MSASNGPPEQRAADLVGRAAELRRLRAFVDGAAVHGGALLVVADAGLGKTALLEAAAVHAAREGAQVLRATGAEFEARLGYGALHQLLSPLATLRSGSGEVPAALATALGLAQGPPPEPSAVIDAAAEVLRGVTERRPALLVVDDFQWVDRPSAAVVASLAERTAGTRVGVLAAARPGGEGRMGEAAVPRLPLGPLGTEDAIALVSSQYPLLTAAAVRRVVDAARGNPLALRELPATALGGTASTVGQPRVAGLPVPRLTERLEALYGDRIAALSPGARFALLVLALDGDGDGDGDLAELAVVPDGEAAVAEAESAGLIGVDRVAGRAVFWHPLVRTSVVATSTGEQRRTAHAALAAALRAQPHRRVWHLAEAVVGPDDAVAGALEVEAHRLLARGDAVRSVDALVRAAHLSRAAPDRARRLAAAAYLGARVSGDLRTAAALLRESQQDGRLDPSLRAATVSAYLLLTSDGDARTAHRLLLEAVRDRLDAPEETGAALSEALYALLDLSLKIGDPECWHGFERLLAGIGDRVPPLLDVIYPALADPARTAASVVPAVEELLARAAAVSDPLELARIGLTASHLHRLERCLAVVLDMVEEALRSDRVGLLFPIVGHVCEHWTATGRWAEAEDLAERALRVAREHDLTAQAFPLRVTQSVMAAIRGDEDAVSRGTRELTAWAAPRGIDSVVQSCQYARGLLALGQGDADEAYWQLSAVSPPGSLPPYRPLALTSAVSLVEAAARSGRSAEARAHVAELYRAGVPAISPRMAMLTSAASGLAEPDDAAAVDRFTEALAGPEASLWLVDAARIRLALGERLRRARDPGAARPHLARAAETFEDLGARPWAERARIELTAAGGAPSGSAGDRRPWSLTPQERQVAGLAATGLTNREIGERLGLSPRTVGVHLYRAFPKLGVTSRAALRDALRDDVGMFVR